VAGEEEAVLEVRRWAEIRRMREVEGLSIHEIVRRTGHDRNTVRRALRSEGPPRYERPSRPSKLDPFRVEIQGLLQGDPRIPSKRIQELIEEFGYDGGKTILDDYVREVRPLYERRRTYQRTVYRPGELLQLDLWEPRGEIPVGHGQTRRGWVVTAELGYSRAIAAALVFSKEWEDLAFGMTRCLAVLGALPEKLVWDREGAIHAGGGAPTDVFAGFCGELRVGWVILEARDPEAKGALERSHRFMRTNFEPGRSFANELDYQLQLDGWCEKVNARVHRTTRAVVAERLAAERQRMRGLPVRMPDADRRFVIRVPAQPYLRFDTNDYSLDPRLVGRRVDVRVTQSQVTAVVLDTGELACRHRRRFARHLTLTDPAHQTELERLRGARRRSRDVDVELRPLARYDALIPA
jgi:transcriptional regulator with XRE-family HTH domain